MPYEHNALQTWEIDNNKFLRVRSRVMQSGVMLYGREELGIAEPDAAWIYVSPEVLFDPKTMYSLEGMPVVANNHEWIEANEDRKEYEVGNVAGKPRQNGAYLEVDLIIRDPETIERVKTGELLEISAGYLAEFNMEKGSYDGIDYVGEQRHIRFNHVAILPPNTGRGGREIRILNSKGKTVMPDLELVAIKFNNRNIRVHPSDADVFRQDIEQRVQNEMMSGQQVEEALAQAKEAMAAKEAAEAALAEAQGKLSEMQSAMEEVMNPGKMQEMADAMVEEQTEAADVMEAANAYEDREKTMNACRGLVGHGLRVAVINACRKVQNRDPLTEDETKNEGFVTGVYNTMRDHLKSQSENDKKTRTVPGSKVVNSQLENGTKRVANKDPLGYAKHKAFMKGE